VGTRAARRGELRSSRSGGPERAAGLLERGGAAALAGAGQGLLTVPRCFSCCCSKLRNCQGR
jgi:hypothetical protein